LATNPAQLREAGFIRRHNNISRLTQKSLS
jgi:hypothetical protein